MLTFLHRATHSSCPPVSKESKLMPRATAQKKTAFQNSYFIETMEL